LLSVTITLLLLRNNYISLYQSSNFIWSLLNYLESGTIIFSIYISDVISTSAIGVYALNMLLNTISIVLVLFKVSYLVIFNNSSTFSNISILVAQFSATAPCLSLSIVFVQLSESKTINLIFFSLLFSFLFYFSFIFLF